MKYLLDANAVIALVNGNSKVIARIRTHAVDDIAISSIVAFELAFGAYRSQRTDDNLARLESLPFETVPFDAADARQAGEIRATLAKAGTPIGPYDIQIAGQARARGLILVTNNIREFKRVPKLKVEDWQGA